VPEVNWKAVVKDGLPYALGVVQILPFLNRKRLLNLKKGLRGMVRVAYFVVSLGLLAGVEPVFNFACVMAAPDAVGRGDGWCCTAEHGFLLEQEKAFEVWVHP
jgi:hypothetical protein